MRYTLKENLYSAALGCLLIIPVIYAADKSRNNIEPPADIPYYSESYSFHEEIETRSVKNLKINASKQSTVTKTETETESETVTDAAGNMFTPYEYIPLSEELQREIYQISNDYEISYELILAVIKTESQFNVECIGDSGQAIGLCQIWPYWWGKLAAEKNLNIYDPADNVQLCVIILTNALDDNAGDLSKGLKQYNSGNPNYESNDYVNEVYENYTLILDQEENHGN